MRNKLHSICPYFAMYPESFVKKYLAGCVPGTYVFDPFSGRGTTIFEALLNGYRAAGSDVNPVAACISNAKGNPPSLAKVKSRLHVLKKQFATRERRAEFPNEFFRRCFHSQTFTEIQYLKKRLKWKVSRTDNFIAALLLGALHGESHKSPNYLSNRMPRTISTKPRYSLRWWKERHLRPPLRNSFLILERMAEYRLDANKPKKRARVAQCDARQASLYFPYLKNRVTHVITSPPYLNVTDFVEDQWLRLWFLGGPPYLRTSGGDDRNSSRKRYWRFLAECWAGIAPLLTAKATIVIRIGGKHLSHTEISENLRYSLVKGLRRKVMPIRGSTVSRIKNGQARSFQPKATGISREYDFAFNVKTARSRFLERHL